MAAARAVHGGPRRRESPATTPLTTGSGKEKEKERGELERETEGDGLGLARDPSVWLF